MKLPTLLPFMCACLLLAGCAHRTSSPAAELATDSIRTDTTPTRPAPKPLLKGTDIVIEKDLLYDKYTLKDTYPQKDTAWSFKWTLIEEWLAEVENMQRDSTCRWVVMQNYKNRNREAPVVRNYHRNDYGRVSDSLNIERYQSAPLYLLTDTAVPERYGRDGTLAYEEGEEGSFMRIRLTGSGEKWLVPKRYLKELPDSTRFRHVIIVDRGSQHIATLERQAKGHWLVRSMNPCTTGRRRPPYAQPTPLGVPASGKEAAHGLPERRFGGTWRIRTLRLPLHQRSLSAWCPRERTPHPRNRIQLLTGHDPTFTHVCACRNFSWKVHLRMGAGAPVTHHRRRMTREAHI